MAVNLISFEIRKRPANLSITHKFAERDAVKTPRPEGEIEQGADASGRLRWHEVMDPARAEELSISGCTSWYLCRPTGPAGVIHAVLSPG